MKKILLIITIVLNVLAHPQSNNQKNDIKQIISSKNYEIESEKYKNITIKTYFFEKDSKLAKKYIKKAIRYIKFYENLIGEYPFKELNIVEIDKPVGYSIPKYIFLSSMLVSKDFIIERSLRHEIVHQWFGEAVLNKTHDYIEGLTTYLSDYLYEKENRKDLEFRKDILNEYPIFVDEKKEFPLKDFKGRFDRASMLIGYGKGFFVFYMMEKELSKELFFKKLKKFYKKYRFKNTSYKDVCNFFAKSFSQWFEKKGMAEIEIKNLKTTFFDDKFQIDFQIDQKSNFSFSLPITIITEKDEINKKIKIDKKSKNISLKVKDRPLKMIVDKDLTIFRKLSQKESYKILGNLFASKNLKVVTKNKKEFSALKNIFKNAKMTDKPSAKDIQNADILFLEDQKEQAKRVLDIPFYKQNEKIFIVKKNPLNRKKALSFFSFDEKILKKIPHYLKYSALLARDGKIIDKKINHTPNGIHIKLSHKDIALKVPKALSLEEILPKLKDKRAVFVGENHPNFTNHLNQLKVIKYLHQNGKKIAIGMEMFQREFQNVINDYLNDKIDLKTFLEKTQYFKRWKFNYNLYKPIIDYAKKNHIPIIALNIDSKISQKVSREGIFALSKEEMDKLPSSIDFGNKRYEEDMNALLTREHLHMRNKKKNFKNHIFEAQILWDETMAETAANFLKNNPSYSMVILAGNGHIANFYGIPQRLERRINLPSCVIAQNIEPFPKSADFVILTSNDIKPKEPLKLGVYLKNDKTLIVDSVVKNSIASKLKLKKGDKILKINQKSVKDLGDLKLELYFIKPNSKITVTIKRGNKIKKLSAKI